MKPSPNAPPGATGRPRPPHPHPDEGPASQVPGAPSSDPSSSAVLLEPPGSPPSPFVLSMDEMRAVAEAVTRLGQDVDDPAHLRDARLADIVAGGHGADRVDIAGVPGSIRSGIRGDLDVLIGFVSQHEMAGARGGWAPAMFRLRRRLDVAYELFVLRRPGPAWEAANDTDPLEPCAHRVPRAARSARGADLSSLL